MGGPGGVCCEVSGDSCDVGRAGISVGWESGVVVCVEGDEVAAVDAVLDCFAALSALIACC